jgi:Flp pilus assembly protein TadD
MNQASTPELDALLQHLTELLQSGAHSEAEILAARSRAQFPDDAELIRMHGIALLQLGRRTEAIEILQHAATVAPHSIEVQCNLAAMLSPPPRVVLVHAAPGPAMHGRRQIGAPVAGLR